MGVLVASTQAVLAPIAIEFFPYMAISVYCSFPCEFRYPWHWRLGKLHLPGFWPIGCLQANPTTWTVVGGVSLWIERCTAYKGCYRVLSTIVKVPVKTVPFGSGLFANTFRQCRYVSVNNKKGALDSKMLKHLLGTDYYGCPISFYMELNGLVSLHGCVVV